MSPVALTALGRPDGFTFYTDGIAYEVELGLWQAVKLDWWLAAHGWEWARDYELDDE